MIGQQVRIIDPQVLIYHHQLGVIIDVDCKVGGFRNSITGGWEAINYDYYVEMLDGAKLYFYKDQIEFDNSITEDQIQAMRHILRKT